MKARYRLGTMVAVMPDSKDEAPLTYYGVIDRIITCIDCFVFSGASFNSGELMGDCVG